ncbi:MAG: ribonuclease HI family protein [Planctomycetota bacterium]
MADLHLRIYTDGGAKGNPGPAGAGIFIEDAASGEAIHEAGVYLGRTTNNVAEYQGMLYGLKMAQTLNASRVELISDSELMVRQMTGQYRVKNAGLKPLYEEAKSIASGFADFQIRHVRREHNKDADRLVNQAIKEKRNIEGAVEF